jgi:hypothetical protein
MGLDIYFVYLLKSLVSLGRFDMQHFLLQIPEGIFLCSGTLAAQAGPIAPVKVTFTHEESLSIT